jgi:hypothetical protein
VIPVGHQHHVLVATLRPGFFQRKQRTLRIQKKKKKKRRNPERQDLNLLYSELNGQLRRKGRRKKKKDGKGQRTKVPIYKLGDISELIFKINAL